MPRYIDADKMIEKLNESKRHDKNSLHILLMNEDDIIEFIERQNTEDVAPIVYAHWIEGAITFTCSNCGICQLSPEKYCSNCGAKMDEVI